MNQVNRVMCGDTKYHGIYVQKEAGHFWIMDANGGEEYIGTLAPSNAHIDNYRNKAAR